MGQEVHSAPFLPVPRLACPVHFWYGPSIGRERDVSLGREAHRYYAASKEYDKGAPDDSSEPPLATQVSLVGPQYAQATCPQSSDSILRSILAYHCCITLDVVPSYTYFCAFNCSTGIFRRCCSLARKKKVRNPVALTVISTISINLINTLPVLFKASTFFHLTRL